VSQQRVQDSFFPGETRRWMRMRKADEGEWATLSVSGLGSLGEKEIHMDQLLVSWPHLVSQVQP
jgi:hypothetical protein